MFKAIKDNKIIAINETGDFPCLVHDSVEEDTEHTVSDYMQVNGEYVLTSSDEAVEQRKVERIAELQSLLNETDWYAVRFAETGVEIPDAVKAERQAAREEISRLRSEGDNG